jgi:hypothetical protein
VARRYLHQIKAAWRDTQEKAMSIIDTGRSCPLCGKTVGVIEDGETIAGNTTFNCRTNEQEFVCGDPKCSFAWFQEIKHINGRPFWVETSHYPMDENGKVLRPPEPPTAARVKKEKVDHTPRTSSVNVANSVLF